MSVSNYLISGFILKKARKLSAAARLEDGEKADLLFQEAYKSFEAYSPSRAWYPDALHSWGLALLNQSSKKSGDSAIKILDEAIIKFNLCNAVKPNHLGASLDGGVALMAVAKIKCLDVDDALYVKAQESFLSAEEIQQGVASYNLACLYALQGNADACLASLKKAQDCALLPEEQDILNDSDLNNIKELSWFTNFIASLADDAEPETQVKDENKIEYDVEGNIKKEDEKDIKKFPETERDGKIFDVEGNLIRVMDTEKVTAKAAEPEAVAEATTQKEPADKAE